MAKDQITAQIDNAAKATNTSTIKVARPAAAYGEDDTQFLWHPYLPIGNYTVLMAAGGVGKTVVSCGIAAAVSTGRSLPSHDGDEQEGKNVLIISAEDSGEMLKKRLSASGADLSRVYVLDRETSVGLDLVNAYDEFESTIMLWHPRLVIIDPWHAYLGSEININKVNAVRPILQRLSNLARKCECSLILVSHTNKKPQGENANNAATGSVDFINASRSVLSIIFDEENENGRILVHTKSNYAAYGPSIRYNITDDGGLEWAGYSSITRQTLEAAARRRSTPAEVAQFEERKYQDSPIVQTVKVLLSQSTDSSWEGTMSDLLTEGAKITHHPLASSGRALSSAISRLERQMYEDGIAHERIPHGTGGARHRFRMSSLDSLLELDPKLIRNIPF